jgi:hypothetical protein
MAGVNSILIIKGLMPSDFYKHKISSIALQLQKYGASYLNHLFILSFSKFSLSVLNSVEGPSKVT